jgi:hypothetical protein
MPSTTTRSPAFTPLEDLDPARAARADLHRHVLDLVAGDAVQEGLLAQLLAATAPAPAAPGAHPAQLHLQQHARAQPALRIVELGARGERARGGVDARADRGDAAFEDFAGKASLVARTRPPTASAPRLRSGTEKSSWIFDTSSSVVITVPGVTSEPG